jgi:hypothetical protein
VLIPLDIAVQPGNHSLHFEFLRELTVLFVARRNSRSHEIQEYISNFSSTFKPDISGQVEEITLRHVMK